jgi:endogenous inhibitor of DNA gyrase (YacG/DUF329 family)
VKKRCPTCKTQFQAGPDNPFSPFCSERCKLIDLGEWLNESHRIPSDEVQNDLYDNPDGDDRTH